MIILIFIIFIILCLAFCFLFYKILEVEKDVEILYKNYSEEIKKMHKILIKLLGDNQ